MMHMKVKPNHSHTLVILLFILPVISIFFACSKTPDQEQRAMDALSQLMADDSLFLDFETIRVIETEESEDHMLLKLYRGLEPHEMKTPDIKDMGSIDSMALFMYHDGELYSANENARSHAPGLPYKEHSQ